MPFQSAKHHERDQQLDEGEPHTCGHEISERPVALPSARPRSLEERDASAVGRHEHVRGERGVVLRVEAIVHEGARASRRDDPAVALRLGDDEGAVSAREAGLRRPTES